MCNVHIVVFDLSFQSGIRVGTKVKEVEISNLESTYSIYLCCAPVLRSQHIFQIYSSSL